VPGDRLEKVKWPNEKGGGEGKKKGRGGKGGRLRFRGSATCCVFGTARTVLSVTVAQAGVAEYRCSGRGRKPERKKGGEKRRAKGRKGGRIGSPPSELFFFFALQPPERKQPLHVFEILYV